MTAGGIESDIFEQENHEDKQKQQIASYIFKNLNEP